MMNIWEEGLMKHIVKQVCFFMVTVMLLVFIISIPGICFMMDDKKLYADSHTLSKVDFSLSSEIRDIPLVYRIHELLDSYYGEEYSTLSFEANAESELLQEEVTIELQEGSQIAQKYSQIDGEMEFDKLTQYESLNRIFKVPTEQKNVNHTLAKRYEEYDENMMEVTVIYDDNWNLQYIYDTECEKILRITLSHVEGKKLNSEWKRKAMGEFITYLNLDILEDWYDNGDCIISNKAHLSLSFEENEEEWTLGFKIV